MAINTVTDILNASANSRQVHRFIRNGSAGVPAGGQWSGWGVSNIAVRSYPWTGAIPTSAIILNNTTAGGLMITNSVSGNGLSIVKASVTAATVANIELHDRLMHMGGLDSTLTSSQTVSLDLHANIAADNLAARRGPSDYSEVQWWINVFANLGATSRVATVTYNDQNGTSRTCAVTIPANCVGGRMIPIIPTIDNGFIRSVTSLQLNGSTGVAGNFGVAVTSCRLESTAEVANRIQQHDWMQTELAIIHDNSCLAPIITNPSTVIPLVQGYYTMVER
jgi:hypothetical protein